MGRITVFAADGCVHCTRVKIILNKYSVPFTEISITKYPEKRADMVALSDRMSTPQVFFNTRHVGGADETIELLHKWDKEKKKYKTPLERYQAEIGRHPDPGNARFDVPDGAPVTLDFGPPRGNGMHCVTLPDGRMSTYVDVMETLKKILPIKDQRHNLTIYANCFTGGPGIEAIKKYYDINDEQAIAFGQHLQKDLQMLQHVTGDHLFGGKGYFYRLHCYQTPAVLNSYRVWLEDVDPDSMRLLRRLKYMMDEMECATTDEEGNIDYVQISQMKRYVLFEEAVCELQKVDLAAMDETTKNAFGINLYNLMIKYAFIKVGVPDGTMARTKFFSGVSFNVGGYEFTFSSWEHGILRGNRTPPHAVNPCFPKKDPRAQFAVKNPDFRFHFALNCGAKSCPPVNSYSVKDFDEEMRLVAQSFCEDDSNVMLDKKANEVRLNKIFSWYRPDFAGSNEELLDFLSKHLRALKQQTLGHMRNGSSAPKITYLPYDWSTNSKNHLKFHANCLNTNSRTVKAFLRKAEELPKGSLSVKVEDVSSNYSQSTDTSYDSDLRVRMANLTTADATA